MSQPSAPPPFVCPLCSGPLERDDSAYACRKCSRTFPILSGIPDFRVEPDRYISIEDDRRKGLRLQEEAGHRGFAAMLDLYYSITPEIPAALIPKFKAHDLAAAEIAESSLAEIGEHGSGMLLDLGCRSAGLLAAAARRFPAAVGIDVAFRWLMMAQARLRETGVSATLVCANAEHLPFGGDTFAVVTAVDLAEHVVDPARVLAECRRVTTPGGACYVATNNRYSMLPEPHVNVWGVGWLPRSLQASYVRLVSGRDYRNISLISGGELLACARRAGFADCTLAPAPLVAPGRSQRALAAYNRWRRRAGLAWILRRFGPRLQLLCRK